MAEKSFSEQFYDHPLWEDYQFTLSVIREIRPQAETGDVELNNRLDLLEDRATDLLNIMSKDKGIPDERRDSPLLQKWEEKWRDLRRAASENREEEMETIMSELTKLRLRINRERFSDNLSNLN